MIATVTVLSNKPAADALAELKASDGLFKGLALENEKVDPPTVKQLPAVKFLNEHSCGWFRPPALVAQNAALAQAFAALQQELSTVSSYLSLCLISSTVSGSYT